MPRVSGVYSRPAGIDAVSGAVIDSADYNLNIADVEFDLNLARPIVAGGTEASNVTQARANLQTERAMATVTNYAAQVWENGSFWSDSTVADSPVPGHRFVGTAWVANNNPDYITIEARDMDDTSRPGLVWVREKLAGVWDPGGWVLDDETMTPAFNAKVNKSGDTMTGGLTAPGLAINNGAADGGNLQFMSAGNNEWDIDNVSGMLRFFAPATNVWGNWNSANGALSLSSAAASTSPTTGALTVAGGLGCGGALWINGTQAASAVVQHWGIYPGINFSLKSGADAFPELGTVTSHDWYLKANETRVFRVYTDTLKVLPTTASSSPTTGALTVAGGLGIGEAANIGGGINATGSGGSGPIITSIDSRGGGATIAMAANYNGLGQPGLYTVGAFPLQFGVNAITKMQLTAAGDLQVLNTTPSSNPTTGALTVAGGVGVGGAIYAGGGINATASIAGNFGVILENTNAASTAAAFAQFKNNAAKLAYVFLGSSTYAGYGGANALNIMTDTGGGPIAFTTNGSTRGQFAADGGLVMGSPTGGSKGVGTINAQAVYDDNVLLTCFGAQYAARGSVDLAQWDAVAPNGKHTLAHKFVEMLKDFDPRNPQEYVERMLRDEALPGMPTTRDWKHGEQSLGEMHNRLWLAVELLASAFAGAVQRIGDLEAKQREVY